MADVGEHSLSTMMVHHRWSWISKTGSPDPCEWSDYVWLGLSYFSATNEPSTNYYQPSTITNHHKPKQTIINHDYSSHHGHCRPVSLLYPYDLAYDWPYAHYQEYIVNHQLTIKSPPINHQLTLNLAINYSSHHFNKHINYHTNH